jgi:hypothetical protein
MISWFEWGVIGFIIIVSSLIWIATNIETVAAFFIRLGRGSQGISKRITGEKYFLVYYKGFKKCHQIYLASDGTPKKELRKKYNTYLKTIGKGNLINKRELIIKAIWL